MKKRPLWSFPQRARCLLKKSLQLLAGEQLIGLQILGDGLVDHVLGQIVVAVRMGLQPVADKLLIKRGLAVARLMMMPRVRAYSAHFLYRAMV